MKESHKAKDMRLGQELGRAHIRGDLSLAIKIEQALNIHRGSSGTSEEDRATALSPAESGGFVVSPREDAPSGRSKFSSSLIEPRLMTPRKETP